MLGELLQETTGKVTGTRVLPDGKVETTIQDNSKLLAVETTEVVTVLTEVRPDGTLYGEYQGVGTNKEGEAHTLKGSALGWSTAPGAVAWRGIKYFSSSSAKLARLNKGAAIFEYAVDADGNTRGKFWEWK